MRRADLASSIGGLAGRAKQALPQMVVHQHLRDAASAVRAKNDTGARRHLHAAIASLAPQSLLRHGITDDESHLAAKRIMNEAGRHALLVKDQADRDATPDPAQLTAGDVSAIELAKRAVGLPSDAVHPWLPDVDDSWFSTRPAPNIGETAEEVRASLGIGVRRVRPGDRPDLGGLASALGLA